MKLNPQMVKGAEPRAERYELKDGAGLVLVVYPSGQKTWQYRTNRGRVVLGHAARPGEQFEPMSLRSARDARALAKAKIATGETPKSAEPVTEPEPVEDDRIGTGKAWCLYMDLEGSSCANATEKWRMWNRNIKPVIGEKKLADVTRSDCSKIISDHFNAIRATGGNGVGANKLHGHLSRFFTWSLREGWEHTLLDRNPMTGVCKLAKEKPRERWLTPQELGWFFRALPRMASDKWNDNSPAYARGFELLLRLVARRSEVFRGEWAWQLQEDRYLVPETKNALPHLLWLHPTCVSLIGKKPASAEASDLILGVHPESTEAAMRRLREAMAEVAAEDGEAVDFQSPKLADGKENPHHFTLHDFRTTATTIMAGADPTFLDENDRQLVPPHIRDKLLNHKDPTVRARHYDFHVCYPEKKAALRLWNDWLDDIKKAALGRNILNLKSAA
jgi:integrase